MDKTTIETISEIEALRIGGGDYVEFGIGFIYGVGAVAAVTGIGFGAVALAGAAFLAWDYMHEH